MTLDLLVAVALFFVPANDPTTVAPTGPSPTPLPRPPIEGRPSETPPTEVCVGDIAPDFSFQGPDARWRRLRDITDQGPVLLVFGAGEPTLQALEHERESLL